MKKWVCLLFTAVTLFSLWGCSQQEPSAMYMKPTDFSEETLSVLDLFDDEIQFFDISLDPTVKSFSISLWVYRDGEWIEDGKSHGNSVFLGNRIAVRLTETSFELYNISKEGHEKLHYPVLDTAFDESTGLSSTSIDRKIPLELNREIPVWVKLGTSSNQMEVFDITEDFREAECNAGIAVTLTLSDEMIP